MHAHIPNRRLRCFGLLLDVRHEAKTHKEQRQPGRSTTTVFLPGVPENQQRRQHRHDTHSCHHVPVDCTCLIVIATPHRNHLVLWLPGRLGLRICTQSLQRVAQCFEQACYKFSKVIDLVYFLCKTTMELTFEN